MPGIIIDLGETETERHRYFLLEVHDLVGITDK